MERRRNEHEPFLPCSWDDVPLILEIKEAAQILKYTPEQLIKLSKLDDPQKRFPAGKVGKGWRVGKTALIDYLVRQGVISDHEATQ